MKLTLGQFVPLEAKARQGGGGRGVLERSRNG